MDEIARRSSEFVADDAQVARLLDHPVFVRIGRHAQDFHLARARADQRQDVIFKTPDWCPNAFGEKVARQKRLLMTSQELGSGIVVPTGRIGTKSVFAKNVADGSSFDICCH